MIFKTSIRCNASPKLWCFTFRFYELDPSRSNRYLTPEMFTCTNDTVFTTRLFGLQKDEGTSLEPYQIHFVSNHNCSTIGEDNAWRTIDLHYKNVPIETKFERFRIRLDVTDSGQLQRQDQLEELLAR